MIVDDDGDTDNTWAMLSKHVGFIRLQQGDHGRAEEDSVGTKQVIRGDIVAYLDADDFLPADSSWVSAR